MGIELPPELADVAQRAGVYWPSADEEKMRTAAAAWRAAGTAVDTAGTDADSAATSVFDGFEGEASDAARERWETFSSDEGRFRSIVRGCEEAAARLEFAADQIAATKVEIIRRLVLLAVKVDAAEQSGIDGDASAEAELETLFAGAQAEFEEVNGTLASAVEVESGDALPEFSSASGDLSAFRPEGGTAGQLLDPQLAELLGLDPDSLVPGLGPDGLGGEGLFPGGPGSDRDGSPILGGDGFGNNGFGSDDEDSLGLSGLVDSMVDSGELSENEADQLAENRGFTWGEDLVEEQENLGASNPSPSDLRDLDPESTGPIPMGVIDDVANTALHAGDPGPGTPPGGQAGFTHPSAGAGVGPAAPGPSNGSGYSGPSIPDPPSSGSGERPAPPSLTPSFAGPPPEAAPAPAPTPRPDFAPPGQQANPAPPAPSAPAPSAPGGSAPPSGGAQPSAPAPAPGRPMPTIPAPGGGFGIPGGTPAPSMPGAPVPPSAPIAGGGPGPVAPAPGGAPVAPGAPGAPGGPVGGPPAGSKLGGMPGFGGPVGGPIGAGGPALGGTPGVGPAPGMGGAPAGGMVVGGGPVVGHMAGNAMPGKAAPMAPAGDMFGGPAMGADHGAAGRPVRPQQVDAELLAFTMSLFPLGHMPVPSARPARQLPVPPRETDFAPGIRFPPQDHPQSDLVDLRQSSGRDNEPTGVEENGCPARLREGHDSLGDLNERVWDRRFLVRAAPSDHSGPAEYAWPPGELFREGAADPAGSEAAILPVGTRLDRLGTPHGRVFAEADTKFAARSLPPEYADRPYTQYVVQKPLPAWRAVSAPWFAQPGGGLRFRLTQSAVELVQAGYLAVDETASTARVSATVSDLVQTVPQA
ncbi:TNT domain-containing protein [Actinoalloteichus hymeniacidonis]|uniref:DUF4237 family protein n=1 Tax=Actinoalloteichus hymeniacidonis TaxID=340345 RepID=A0AAC9HVZ2_9PSEU|nr:TNT domain-containing protein [Actinoalloteichus hymeniacidonis]AOS65495.1 putative DUF4237 family protein [Actinoalloteichus hymeniacidonis]MBB5906418.1 hypothetical protein [Actinoalloteichus hymeniacidonis]